MTPAVRAGGRALDRRAFVRAAAAVLALPAAAALAGAAGCSGAAGSGTGAGGSDSEGLWAGLAWKRGLDLAYATEFSVDYFEGGYVRLSLSNGDVFLVVPQGAQAPASLPEGVVALYSPFERIYLVASQAMDYFRALGAIPNVRFAGLPADSWYIEEAKEALESGEMLYAGKYSAPDYETLVSQGCDLAVENTMVYHTPEVKEQLEASGIPVIVERTSYEGHPLARMEWLKFYGALLGKDDEAADLFDRQIELVSEVLGRPATGLTVAYFYITENGAVTVRKPGDYVSKAIELAGGVYALDGKVDTEENALSTVTMQMEAFYDAARDADRLIYNSSIAGALDTIDALLDRGPALADFKAVKSGCVWCTGADLFQEPLGLGDFIVDVGEVLSDPDVSDDGLTYLHRLV